MWRGNYNHSCLREEGDAEVLGVYALEGLSLEVDPITKELRKSEAILAL